VRDCCQLCDRQLLSFSPRCLTCGREHRPTPDELAAALDDLRAQDERDEERESERVSDHWDEINTYGR
jgi:hypothetical protein